MCTQIIYILKYPQKMNPFLRYRIRTIKTTLYLLKENQNQRLILNSLCQSTFRVHTIFTLLYATIFVNMCTSVSVMIIGFLCQMNHSALRSGFKWKRQLILRSKLTMHTAFDRKDNPEPASVTSLAISKFVQHP